MVFIGRHAKPIRRALKAHARREAGQLGQQKQSDPTATMSVESSRLVLDKPLTLPVRVPSKSVCIQSCHHRDPVSFVGRCCCLQASSGNQQQLSLTPSVWAAVRALADPARTGWLEPMGFVGRCALRVRAADARQQHLKIRTAAQFNSGAWCVSGRPTAERT